MPSDGHIWILGATGYVGRALSVAAMKEYPPARLITFGHRKMDARLMEESNHFVCPLNEISEGLLERYPPKKIFHCARMAGSSDRKRHTAAQKGAAANERLIQMLRKMKDSPVLIYCSGSLMYGPQTSEANEQTPLKPIGYARAYLQAEEPFLNARNERHLDARMARPAWILGPGSWFHAFFLDPAKKTGKVPYYGSGEQLMSVLSLKSCAVQLLRVADKGAPFSDQNLVCYAPLTQRDFSQILADILGLPTIRVPESALLKRHGKTVTEALCTSIPIGTLNDDWRTEWSREVSGLRTDLLELIHFDPFLRRS